MKNFRNVVGAVVGYTIDVLGGMALGVFVITPSINAIVSVASSVRRKIIG